MRDKPYVVRPSPTAHEVIRSLATVTERAKRRQQLINRTPFPGSFATYTEAEAAARKAGPEFEVVVQS